MRFSQAIRTCVTDAKIYRQIYLQSVLLKSPSYLTKDVHFSSCNGMRAASSMFQTNKREMNYLDVLFRDSFRFALTSLVKAFLHF